MLYIEKINTAFAIPQKCASTSIKSSIRKGFNIPYNQWKDWEQEHQITPEDTRGKITIGVVRNPFDRLVSCYLNQCLQSDRYNLGKDAYFEEFVDYVCKQDHKTADKHFRPLYVTVPERLTFLIRYETINQDWGQVQKCFPMLPKLMVENKMVNRMHWSFYYNKDTLNKVHNYYQKDLKQWQY